MIGTGRQAMVAATIAVALSGCGSGAGGRQADRPTRLSHVHGLGVNPVDGALFVATHHGLFRLDEDGRPRRVGESRQDTMGFTVAGPDRFLGSGHPEESSRRMGGEPPLLGLIESTDAGRTWRTLSLQGEADFHTLLAAHDRIYGWNSVAGQVMVSTDGGLTWQRRGELPLVSFAVDPADPERLLGSGRQGLVASGDGGRTWQSVPGGPGPGLLAWDREAGLWAAQLDGAVFASDDGGRTWERRGSLPGNAAALLATKDRLYAATAAAQVVRSGDGGRTWTTLYEPGE